MFIFAEIASQRRNEAEAALLPFLKGRFLVLEEAPAPPKISDASVDEKLAQKIADAIRPNPKQPMRREVLAALARGYDSFFEQHGERDNQMRNGLGALSKALRRFTFMASPIELIANRTRRMIADGPHKGRYESTVYTLNPLGKRVFEILKSKGVL